MARTVRGRTAGAHSRIAEFVVGASFIGRGFATWRTAPGLMFLGLIPALIVAAAFVCGFIALGLNLQNIAVAVTPFAEGWDEPLRGSFRILIALAFLAFAIIIVAFTFTTVTLIVGEPFYERIWRHVESRYGEVPNENPAGAWRSFWRGVGDGLRMLLPTVLLALPLFLLGLIPVVGTVLAAIIGAFVGGWFLAVELSGVAFDARGRSLRERRLLLRARRPMTLGFGVVTYLLFLVPLGAVIVMPAAVAGSAHLARRVFGEDAVSAEPRTGS